MNREQASLIARRIGIPMKQHHMSVSRSNVRFRTAFTDKYHIREGDRATFCLCQDGTVLMVVFHADIMQKHVPAIRYVSSEGLRCRQLAVHSESSCETLKGLFHAYMPPYDKERRRQPFLRLMGELRYDSEELSTFILTPCVDLQHISSEKK